MKILNEFKVAKMKIKKIAEGIVVATIALILAFFVMYNFLYYIPKLEDQLDERDITIQNLLSQDSIYKILIGVKYDSVRQKESYTQVTRKDTIISYAELAAENDNLNTRINYLQKSINDKNVILDLIKDCYSITYTIKKNQKTGMTHYRIYAPSLDSAIILLPYAKGKFTLEYSKDGKTYTITEK